MKKIFIILIFNFYCFSQEHKSLFYTSTAGINNPGFIAINNEINHLTLETIQSFDKNKKTSNSSIFYGNTYFQDYNFFLGYKVSSNYFSNIGLGEAKLELSYTHRLRLNPKYILYPFISAHFRIPSKFSNLYFEDQIFSGLSSNDPVLDYYKAKGYIDFNSGFLIKNQNLFFGLSINNITKANTSSNNELAVKIGRSADINLGLQKEFKNFGLFAMGTYFHRPTLDKGINFSEFRLDQEIIFYNFSVNIFEEFFSNTYSNGLKSIGMSFIFPIENYEIGFGYKSNLNESIRSNDNFIGLIFKFNFDTLPFATFLKWEDSDYY